MILFFIIVFVFIPIILVMIYLNIQVNDFEKKYQDLETILKARFNEAQEIIPETSESGEPSKEN